MSIEVTRLSSTQGRDLETVKEWFDTNAAELFSDNYIAQGDLILVSEGSPVISFGFVNDRYTVKVFVNSTNTITVTLASATDFIGRLAKTPNGVAAAFSGFSGATQQNFPYGLFVSRTTEGRLGITLAKSQNMNITGQGFYYESIGGSMLSTSTPVVVASAADDITTLTPCICEGAGGEYMTDCFFTSFSQYKGIDCTFLADDIEYLYNGFIAMR